MLFLLSKFFCRQIEKAKEMGKRQDELKVVYVIMFLGFWIGRIDLK